MSEELRYNIKLTDEQIEALFEMYPHDEFLIAHMCKNELYKIRIPNPIGYTQSGIRVYVDNGSMGSGYIMVHWDDAKKVSWCESNGYYTSMPESEKPIIWVEDPERERQEEIYDMLSKWAYKY